MISQKVIDAGANAYRLSEYSPVPRSLVQLLVDIYQAMKQAEEKEIEDDILDASVEYAEVLYRDFLLKTPDSCDLETVAYSLLMKLAKSLYTTDKDWLPEMYDAIDMLDPETQAEEYGFHICSKECSE